MTLGAILLIVAAVDLVITFLVAISVARRQQALPQEMRGPNPYIIVGAGIVSSAILSIGAFYLPEADLVIF